MLREAFEQTTPPTPSEALPLKRNEIADEHQHLYAEAADLAEATRAIEFGRIFSERFSELKEIDPELAQRLLFSRLAYVHFPSSDEQVEDIPPTTLYGEFVSLTRKPTENTWPDLPTGFYLLGFSVDGARYLTFGEIPSDQSHFIDAISGGEISSKIDRYLRSLNRNSRLDPAMAQRVAERQRTDLAIPSVNYFFNYPGAEELITTRLSDPSSPYRQNTFGLMPNNSAISQIITYEFESFLLRVRAGAYDK